MLYWKIENNPALFNFLARDVIKLLFHCYGLEADTMDSQIDKYSIYEHLPPVQRKIESDESPVYVQSQWSCPDKSRLVLRLLDEDPESLDSDQVQACSSPLKNSSNSSSNSVFARPARVIEVIDDSVDDHPDDSMMTGLDTSYCSSGESTASSEFSALRFRDSPMSASSR